MIKPDTRTIANNIRRLRESKFYSQEYMGAKLGMGQNAYSKLELNKTKMRVEDLLAIAILLEVETIELLSA